MNSTQAPFRHAIAALAIAFIFLTGVGCGTGETADDGSADANPEIVQKALTVAKELQTDPDDVESVLERHGLDVERFEAMMYEISSDPQLAKAYTEQLGS